MLRAATRFPVKAKALKSSIHRLGKAPLPALAVLHSGGFVVVGKVTDDDQVVFYDAHGLVETLPLAGGATTSIDPGAQFVVLDGQSVFSWHAVGQASLVGNLLAWSATSGLHEVAAASTIGDAAATSDGAALLFSDHASDDGRTIDFVLAHADGSSPTTVQTSRASELAGCPPQLVHRCSDLRNMDRLASLDSPRTSSINI